MVGQPEAVGGCCGEGQAVGNSEPGLPRQVMGWRAAAPTPGTRCAVRVSPASTTRRSTTRPASPAHSATRVSTARRPGPAGAHVTRGLGANPRPRRGLPSPAPGVPQSAEATHRAPPPPRGPGPRGWVGETQSQGPQRVLCRLEEGWQGRAELPQGDPWGRVAKRDMASGDGRGPEATRLRGGCWSGGASCRPSASVLQPALCLWPPH